MLKLDYFKLPICYNDKKVELKKNIIDDLELIKTVDSSNTSLMHHVFNPESEFAKNIVDQVSTYYTDDEYFLKDSQTLLKTFRFSLDDSDSTYTDNKYVKLLDIWNEIKNDTGFLQKYYYIDWDNWKFLNNSEQFLQIMSLYNLASPVISLFVPVFILIVPFILIKIKGHAISVEEYIEILKMLAGNHAIGRIFTQFNDVPMDQKIYLMISAAFYLFSIYQNILTCTRFHNNMKTIHLYLFEVNHYISHTVKSMDNFLSFSSNLKTYHPFNEALQKNKGILLEFQSKISSLSAYNIFSPKKILEIGQILKYFYELYCNPIYNDALLYSFGFNGYIEIIRNLGERISAGQINMATFITKSKKKKQVFEKLYYAALIDDETHVKNDVRLGKNIIITGPNASGKTTVLKSTLINLIFTQQFGCGFYKSATICPYKHIHCYLNIPDTSGRDSLFQAEARRCKEIIDCITDNNKDRHFCVFDELYSGTNPDEAVMSALAFMNYLAKYKNVSSLLTTHFMQVCKKLDSNKKFKNYCMNTIEKMDSFVYTYILKDGISEVRGGVKVLSDLNYPKEIIQNSSKI